MADLDELRRQIERKVENAAIAFASGHGPLSGALQGDPECRKAVAAKLINALEYSGLRITSSKI